MNCIYVSTVENFIRKGTDELLEIFKNKFLSVYGEIPDIEQTNAWESSIKYLRECLDFSKIYGLTIAFEYRLPFSGERIDLLIFGKTPGGKPAAIVFELKGWKKAVEAGDKFLVKSDIGESIHPEYQVENYVGKLKFSHSEAENFDFSPAVLMYNAVRENIKLDFSTPVFFRTDAPSLREFIHRKLPLPVERELVDKFLQGKYVQSKKLFEAIKEHFSEIQRQSYKVLAESGWGLSSEQLNLVGEVMQTLTDGRRDIVYLIQGAPGSGKTLVAVHLLLASLHRGFQSVLTYRNNRLINSIRDVFNSIQPGLSAPIKFYSTGRPRNPGVAEAGFRGHYDLVIYDEAQRMTQDNIYHAMQRAPITVFFYDETQILNAEEEGFTENFVKEAENQGKEIRMRFLRGFYRVEGGDQYHKFVETLLKTPLEVNESLISAWKNDYEFKIFEAIEQLLEALERKREEGFKVALVAAFTESPGDLRNPRSLRNLRIGYPLFSGFDIYKGLNREIFWLMDPRRDYVPFWVKGESNRLEKCASIYGCQGFETDFVGLIWGRDFVARDGKWALGEHCEDNTGRPSLKNLFNSARKGNPDAEKLALRLLENRYRIFLTRGIKGTYIFCEDPETAKFLKKLVEKH